MFEPATVEEAVRLLFMYGSRAKVLAGGVNLVMNMRRRLLLPEYVLSIQRIPGLDYVEGDAATGLRIGALATIQAVESSTAVQKGYSVLYEGSSVTGSVQVKTMGTVVGNLCAATPATDLGPPLFVLGAKLRVASIALEKVIPIEEFFVAEGKSVLEPQEMVTEISVPAVSGRVGGAYLRVGTTKVSIPKVNAAVSVTLTDNRCSDVRIALGSVAPTVIRAPRAEEVLRGKQLDEKTIDRASEAAAAEAKPITDVHSTAEYRRTMVKVLVRDALKKAIARAKA
jgi:carbon-monoxide dehydrogenase medium subunit